MPIAVSRRLSKFLKNAYVLQNVEILSLVQFDISYVHFLPNWSSLPCYSHHQLLLGEFLPLEYTIWTEPSELYKICSNFI